MSIFKNISFDHNFFIVPAIFSSAIGSILVSGFQFTEPKPSFVSTFLGFFKGGVYGLAVGGLWPLSLTYYMCNEINWFYKTKVNKQIL
jgi:hypothetical protein